MPKKKLTDAEKRKAKIPDSVGRPDLYTPEYADYICGMIATHTYGLQTLCKKFPEMPHHETIAIWLVKYPEFSDKYRKAKIHRTELQAEEMIDLSEVETYVDDKGIERVDAGRVNLQKLKINTRQWAASKLLPKVYGEKTAVQVTGLSAATDEREMLKCVIKQLENQTLGADDVSKLLALIDTSLRVKQTNELEDRLKALENSTNKS